MFDPDYVPAILHKAEALVDSAERQPVKADKIKDLSGAKDLLEGAALSRDKKNAAVYATLAHAYVDLDELDKAADNANKALLLDRTNLVALNMSGLVKYYRHDCVGAADEFERATEAAPKDFTSYLNLGNAFYGLRSWARAQREYNRALELVPQTSISNTGSQRPYIKYLVARTQHELSMDEQAVQTLSDVLNLRTDFYEAQRLLGAAYSGQKQWQAAEEALKEALKSAPPDDVEKLASTHSHLGEIYEVQGTVRRVSARRCCWLCVEKTWVHNAVPVEAFVSLGPGRATPTRRSESSVCFGN